MLEHKILSTLTDNNKSFLINMIEITSYGATFYGRARDGGDFPELMQKMIKIVNPSVTSHSSETRASFHPNGGPKARGEHYFHHVHFQGYLGEVEELVEELHEEKLMSDTLFHATQAQLVGFLFAKNTGHHNG